MSTVATINPGYEAIVKEAERIGWPAHYKDDLYKHDKEMLTEWHGPFGWSVRETGTWLVRPMDGSCTSHARAVSGKMQSSHLLYIWDGAKLRQVDAEEFQKFFSSQWSNLPEYRVKVDYQLVRGQPYRKSEVVTLKAANESIALEQAKYAKSRNYFDVKASLFKAEGA